MAEYLIQDSTLTNIANPIKTLMGVSGTLTPTDMASNLNNANTAVADAIAALIEKEVEVPEGTNVTGLAALIAAIEGGGGSGGGVKILTNDITFSSDSTYLQTGEMGFGREADIFVVLATNVADFLSDNMNGYESFAIGGSKIKECNTSGNVYEAYRSGYNANSKSFAFKETSSATFTYRALYDEYMITLTKKWKAGVTYRWFAIFEE